MRLDAPTPTTIGVVLEFATYRYIYTFVKRARFEDLATLIEQDCLAFREEQ